MDRNLYNNRINHLNIILLMMTLVACGLCIAHSFYVEPIQGRRLSFLIWNLFLCWVPYFLSFILYKRSLIAKKFGPMTMFLAVIWFLFFPNAIYILTDNLHFYMLRGVFAEGGRIGQTTVDAGLWFSFTVLTLFILLGFIMSMISLYFMQIIIDKKYGIGLGWLFSLSVIFISTYGIYLGRVYRFNSWDVATKPLKLLDGIWQSFNMDTLIFMGILTLLYFPLYILFYGLINTYKRQY